MATIAEDEVSWWNRDWWSHSAAEWTEDVQDTQWADDVAWWTDGTTWWYANYTSDTAEEWTEVEQKPASQAGPKETATSGTAALTQPENATKPSAAPKVKVKRTNYQCVVMCLVSLIVHLRVQ